MNYINKNSHCHILLIPALYRINILLFTILHTVIVSAKQLKIMQQSKQIAKTTKNTF